ncbi:fumarylacetoacetate hydrolase family protein [Vibrio sp. WXL210]|uniref:fumarylacetoacetate hydrolase family protein n=1 Tax=Vibrio sp. WXL210 TaxID=3450709 RepID=UPI003EC6CBDD
MRYWFAWTIALMNSVAVGAEPEQFIRFEYQNSIQYGQLDGQRVYPLDGDLFGDFSQSGPPLKLDSVQLLLPSTPEKVFAVGMNFASHLASSAEGAPPMFLKLPSSLVLSGQPANLPIEATNVHFEGELVLVIGKEAKDVSIEQASEYIFGVTVGNDLTERTWQGSDLQWMRAKAADGFAPIGGTITRGVNYKNAMLTTRLNGKVVQQESTRNMIHSPEKVVAYLSRYFTLKPGDLIFMGTPGRTQALSNNDVVSVEIEGVGMVQNTIVFK